jgi:hypothetical protein
MIKLGTGIFMWDGIERQSNRYGYVYVDDANFEKSVSCIPTFDHENAILLKGKRVEIIAVVTEARKSSHMGDMSLGITPSMPEVGARISIGIGVLDIGESFGGNTTVGLIPEDKREEVWIDPRILYTLHDQSVELYAEESTKPCPPPMTLPETSEEETFALDDGYIQIKRRRNMTPPKSIKIPPRVQALGDGMFLVDQYHSVGSRIEGVEML